MYASYKEVNSFRSVSFIAMMVVLITIVIGVGSIILSDLNKQKNDEEGNA
jgi:hypothetical protein